MHSSFRKIVFNILKHVTLKSNPAVYFRTLWRYHSHSRKHYNHHLTSKCHTGLCRMTWHGSNESRTALYSCVCFGMVSVTGCLFSCQLLSSVYRVLFFKVSLALLGLICSLQINKPRERVCCLYVRWELRYKGRIWSRASSSGGAACVLPFRVRTKMEGITKVTTFYMITAKKKYERRKQSRLHLLKSKLPSWLDANQNTEDCLD